MTRRDSIRAAVASTFTGVQTAAAQNIRGLAPVRITNVKVILTCPPFPGFDMKAYTRLVVT
jgi:hypothetical protein